MDTLGTQDKSRYQKSALGVRVFFGRNIRGGKMGKYIDLTGMRFGRLVVCDQGFSKQKGVYWECVCDCGETSIVRTADLKRGHTRSCGCLSLELEGCAGGFCGSKVYNVWMNIKNRCYNKSYHAYDRYGGRGIIVCSKWKYNSRIFCEWALANGYKEGLQIDRENNNGDYTPENCRFVSPYINNHNQRGLRTDNKSGYCGVLQMKSGKFKAYIRSKILKKPRNDLGLFITLEEAVITRNNFIKTNDLPHKIQIVRGGS